MPGPDIGVREVLYAAINKAGDAGICIRAIEVDADRARELRQEVIDRHRDGDLNNGEAVLKSANGEPILVILKGNVVVREYRANG